MVRKPDLEIVKLLVEKGAVMVEPGDHWRSELMMLLFVFHSERMLQYPSNEVEEECPLPDKIGRICCDYLWADEEEIAQVAMYLADQGPNSMEKFWNEKQLGIPF